MDKELNGVLNNQNRVNSLLSAVGNINHSPNGWMCPGDAAFRPVIFSDLAKESGIETTKDIHSVVKFLKSYTEGWKQPLLSRNKRFISNLLQLSPVTYPKQVLKCPTVDDVQKALSSEQLTISLHSNNGYNFSNEFAHVYKGKFNKGTALEDLLVVLQRALHCVSPSMNNITAAKYADFILRISAWEAALARAVLEESSKGLFPEWTAHTNGSEFQHVEVYLGNNKNGELSFTVRVRFEVDFERTRSVESGASKKATATAADGIDPDVAVESIYYREFLLTDSSVAAFSQASFLSPPAPVAAAGPGVRPGAATQVPPPPPKKSAGGGYDDIRLYLLFSSKLALPEPAVEESSGIVSTSGEAITDGKSVSTPDKPAADGDETSLEGSINVRPRSVVDDTSFCAELFGWGFDSGQSLGLGPNAGKSNRTASTSQQKAGATKENPRLEDAQLQEMVHGPRRIPLDRLIAAERVRMIACSSNHTLLLTCLGSIFGCGDNSEGALGTGDLISRYDQNQILSFFLKQMNAFLTLLFTTVFCIGPCCLRSI